MVVDLKTPQDLFDDSPDQYTEADLKLAPNLRADEIEDALWMAQWTRAGTIVVSGALGSGKTGFADTTAWKLKHYFPDRTAILDYKPRSLFGQYLPFSVIVDSYEKAFKEIIGEDEEEEDGFNRRSAKDKEKRSQVIKDLFDHWLKQYGQSLLKGNVLVLDEFWRYCGKRRTGTAINYFVTGLVKLTRRLDLLIIGMTPSADEIDQQQVIPYCTAEARCMQTTKVGVFQINLYPRRYVDGTGAWEMAGKVKRIFLDGLKPRPELGGKCYLDLYPSKLSKTPA